MCVFECRSPDVITLDEDSRVGDLAVDHTRLYWLEVNNGSVQSAPKTGGAITTLVTGQPGALRIALDATDVYWSSAWSSAPGNTIMRVPKLGGTPTVVTDTGGPAYIALDDTRVYWLNRNEGTISSVAKSGGAVTRLATLSNAVAFSVAGGQLYFGDDTGVYRVPASGGVPEKFFTHPENASLTAFAADEVGFCMGYRTIGLMDNLVFTRSAMHGAAPKEEAGGLLAEGVPLVDFRALRGRCYVARRSISAFRFCDGQGFAHTPYVRSSLFVVDEKYFYVADANRIQRWNQALQ